MTTEAIIPLRQRMIEDISRSASARPSSLIGNRSL